MPWLSLAAVLAVAGCAQAHSDAEPTEVGADGTAPSALDAADSTGAPSAPASPASNSDDEKAAGGDTSPSSIANAAPDEEAEAPQDGAEDVLPAKDDAPADAGASSHTLAADAGASSHTLAADAGSSAHTPTADAGDGGHLLVLSPEELRAALIARTFLLESSEGFTPVGSTIRISFRMQRATFGIQSSCHDLAGNFSICDDNLFCLEPELGSTFDGCATEFFVQEQWLVDFFRSTPALTLQGSRLTFTGEDATLVFLDAE